MIQKNDDVVSNKAMEVPLQSAGVCHSQQNSTCTPSIFWWALVWFTLCTLLVTKHNEMIVVFFAFCGSFAMAFCFWNLEPPCIHTKVRVGLVACMTSLYALILQDNGFVALSITAGYLAFDLWYSFLVVSPTTKSTLRYRRRRPVFTVMEDAVTLTVMIVMLTVYKGSFEYHHHHHLGPYPTTNTLVMAWVVYKTISLLWLLASSSSSSSPSSHENEAKSKLPQNDKTVTDSTCLSTISLPPSSLWYIHERPFDLSDFVERHPGGKEAIELGRGRDATALFESYHPFTEQHWRVLLKYQVQQPNHESTPLLKHATIDPFYDILKERVMDTLKQHGMDPEQDRCAPPLRVAYYAIVVMGLAASAVAHMKGSMLGSFCFALFGWLIGALGHDAGHFAVSRIAWINDVCVWAMSLLCNPVMWQHQHTYAHHSHTNDFDHDPDLHHFELFLRVHRRFQRKDVYQWQSNTVFVIFAYCFVVFGTCFWIPWGMIQTGSLYGFVEWTDRKRPWRALGMWLHLIVYIAVIMVSPFFTSSSYLKAFASVMLHVATSGLVFALFSQINHLNEASMEIKPCNRKSVAIHSWAATQVETSNNFATDSALWHILSNGLNLQIEHHLFPSLNHSHLHLIAPTVKRTCQEYGVMYKCYDSWSELMSATLRWLETLSDAPDVHSDSKGDVGEAMMNKASRAKSM